MLKKEIREYSRFRDLYNLRVFDKNGNDSWFDELNSIVQSEAAKINANVDRNPKTIDEKELASWLIGLSPEDFLENFDEEIAGNSTLTIRQILSACLIASFLEVKFGELKSICIIFIQKPLKNKICVKYSFLIR